MDTPSKSNHFDLRVSKSFQIRFTFEGKNSYPEKVRLLHTTYTRTDLFTAHIPISAQSSNFVVFRLQTMYLLLLKSIRYWYSFELPRQVEAIQMSTKNICFYKKKKKQVRKISHKYQ